MAGATLWALSVTQPDVLIAGDGHSVAVRGSDGRLRIMRTAKDTFLVREWLAADADPRAATDPALATGVSCDPDGCVSALGDGRLVALTLRPDAFADDCTRAAIIVTQQQAPSDCGAMVIDRSRLQRQRGLALRQAGEGFSVTAIRPEGIDRPWSPTPSMAATAPTTRRPRIAPPVDATPVEADRQGDD